MYILFLLSLLLFGCKDLPLDTSVSASEAGQMTQVLGTLGSCQNKLNIGISTCYMTKGQALPKLSIFFANEASYAVSDCDFGILENGSVDKAGLVEIDLSRLDETLKRRGFCFLKVDSIERYPDPKDDEQKHNILLTGGFFIEAIDPNFKITPTKSEIAWCYKIARTTKGRTIMEACVTK